jgi:hypothetical protein
MIPGSARKWIAVNAVQQSIKFSFHKHTPMKHSLKLIAALVAISLCRQVSAAIFNPNDVASLITAINTSNSNGEDDTIELATNGTYTLTAVDNTTNGPNGLPVILSDTGHKLVIHGNGATLGRSTVVGTPRFRIFQIAAGADVTISGLTITNGNANLNTDGVSLGGGIFNNGGTLTITNSTLSGNSASAAGGGVSGEGGGIFNNNGTLTITNSTLSGNSASDAGGGIFNSVSHSNATNVSATITNSTLSGNSAGIAGGILNSQVGSTCCATVTIGDTVLNAGAGANIGNLFSGTITSLGYNLSSDDGGGFLTGPGDQINTAPMLGPLQDNGGLTFTHALLTGSPAIDKGKNFSAATTDQRGPGFARTVDLGLPRPTGGDGTDIGAFEVQTPPPCPQGQGSWKNNPDAWPVTSLMLGSQTYSQTELLTILKTPVKGDASLILADQLIAAKLNIANGSDPTPVSSTITNADSLLSAFGGTLPYHVKTSSATGQIMVNDANTLESYNNGLLTTGCSL